MNEQASLIAEIEAFCRQAGVAESTFGRADGKQQQHRVTFDIKGAFSAPRQ